MHDKNKYFCVLMPLLVPESSPYRAYVECLVMGITICLTEPMLKMIFLKF